MNILNQAIVNFVKILPVSVVHIFAKKYVAGKTLNEAIEIVRDLNSKGILATMDVLGESITSMEKAIDAKDECLKVLEAIDQEKLNANLSVKPTQLGLAIDTVFCYSQLSEILQKAKALNNFVRIDMEDSPYTEATIELYLKLKEKFSNVGIVLQSYLRRTINDVRKLNEEGAHYRLCKGIYVEPEAIAYKGKQEIRDNFTKALEMMLDNGNYVGIATHDKYLVDAAYKMIKEKNIPNDKFEFQMLYGVTENLRDEIINDGYKIRVYTPFGKHWYAYSIRRLQENPQLAWYITKSIFLPN